MIRVFRVFVPASVLVLIVSEFLLLFFSYVAASYLVFTQIDPLVFLLYDDGFARIATVVVVIMLGLYFNDLYGNVRIKSRVLLLQQLCMAVGIAFVTQSVFSYGNQDWTLPKWMMINGSAIAIVLALFWRIMYSHVVLSAMGAERVCSSARHRWSSRRLNTWRTDLNWGWLCLASSMRIARQRKSTKQPFHGLDVSAT
jgi:hypothetical protein